MPGVYVVLREINADTTSMKPQWEYIGDATAATPQAAIKAATDGKPAAERTGTFVATPSRSWKPISRRVEAAEKEIWG